MLLLGSSPLGNAISHVTNSLCIAQPCLSPNIMVSQYCSLHAHGMLNTVVYMAAYKGCSLW